MSKKTFYTTLGLTTMVLILSPQLSFADVEGTLGNIQDTLINRLMPLFGVLGLCWAGFSFMAGNANAKSHMFMAIVGAIIGFGAPSIVEMARGLVN